ncbi:PHA/PHB synthase family protein [Parachitinimonas caeni]|uniref:Class I poly(R)-hydroxyalkanoic acid synthase n=1 Tax=Parachitinimonas caeni TaxID=3031301 RepID=A0ABT7DTZ2_9NEIS|nr:class I poly(R)-hydroxyalkanoic acid synthase [Parachitinimonas caeni]MDK2123542.1 class I poly(R)-hydroxyalkanoic acid synthase [Parachitinimonas caeni]
MTSPSSPQPNLEDNLQRWNELCAKAQKLMSDQFQRMAAGERPLSIPDPEIVAATFGRWWQQAAGNPQPLIKNQMAFWLDYAELWQRSLGQWWLARPAEPVAAPPAGDKRFKDEMWAQNALFDFTKQAYLLASRHIQTTVDDVEGLDPHTAQQVAFYTRQLVDALAPTNFVATNPAALKATLETGGENLISGLSHMLEDLERNNGRLMPKMTDLDAFRLGENIATTPGKVVFRNALIELIQYAPSTEKVHQRPLLVVPPWINKFYILDLKPKNSLIKWLVDQGHTTFVISWVNPDETLRHKNFEDYLREGTLAALKAIEEETGQHQVNVAAYCIGGTLLAATLAWLAAQGEDRVASATFFTTLLDFSDVGELSVFIDDAQIRKIEEYMAEKGFLEGHQMANVFNMLRENDLIWSFVVNNYLLGKAPMPFDLLYWNCDSTRMPAAMHSFYLRNMYLENKLCQPGGITLGGVPIDLGKIEVPAYFISAREDHIAPWKSTYAGARKLSGPVRFVLGGSGHIAGIVNPPSANKYGYSTNPALPGSPEQWLEQATAHEGSWWLDWAKWVEAHQGKLVAARTPGRKLKPLEDAPGSYVKIRL